MKSIVFVAIAFLLSVVGFNSTVAAQGQAFSNEVTAVSGNTKINAVSSPNKNFAVDEVYYYDTVDGEWKPCQDWEYAINPTGQAYEHTCTFINGLVTGRKYKIKYSWTTSQVPNVSISAS